MKRLDGRVVVVTGATRGLGRSIAERLASEGARLVVASRSAESVTATVARLRECGAEAAGLAADVTQAADATRIADCAVEQFGRIDVLVNNAGSYRLRAWSDLEADEFDAVIASNLRSVFLCSKAVYPTMRQQGKGKIVNLGSGVVHRGVMFLAHYTAAKAGVIGLTRAMARELGREGITVNVVTPGIVETDAVLAEYPLERVAAYRTSQALPRPARAEDLAGVVAFLCSDDADFITGQTILVDGGANIV